MPNFYIHSLTKMAAAAPGPLTHLEATLIACGVPNDHVLFEGATKANRIAMEIFDGDLNACLNISFADFESECKTLSTLTVAQGQIRLTPSTKRNIKALIQWSRDKIITGGNPNTQAFLVADAMKYVARYKSHQKFLDRAKTLSEAAKPEKLTETTKWVDWYPTFLNFLRALAGVNGVPLIYIVRENTIPTIHEDPNCDFLENYVKMTPHTGEAYTNDNLEVHTYITYFISGNSTAEAKLISHGRQNDGRADWIALKEHFEGVGVNSMEITKAEHTINFLFYSGEKKPHMWWGEFEKELSRAFAIYQRTEGRVVHSNEMKLRILMGKVQAPDCKSSAERRTLTHTYDADI